MSVSKLETRVKPALKQHRTMSKHTVRACNITATSHNLLLMYLMQLSIIYDTKLHRRLYVVEDN